MKNAGKKKAGCKLTLHPARFLDPVWKNYFCPAFFATVDLAGATVEAPGLVGAAVAGADVEVVVVVVVVGSGSATGVTGLVGFGNGFAIIVETNASMPDS